MFGHEVTADGLARSALLAIMVHCLDASEWFNLLDGLFSLKHFLFAVSA
jgi:hypothetical protein